MKPIRWTGKGHNDLWTNAANWQGGVPADGANVLFANGGTYALDLTGAQPQLGRLTVLRDALTVTDARIDLDSTQSVQGVIIDLVLGQGASLTLTDDALLYATNVVEIGSVQNGTLTSGTLNVGNYSGGTSDGLTVIAGTFSLSGPEVDWSSSSATTEFFADVGGAKAEIIVSNGASLTTYNRALSGDLTIGDAYGDGSMVVTGLGSSLNADTVELGTYGAGTLLLADQATASMSYLTIGALNAGLVSVSSDATLTTDQGITVGSEQPPVVATLSITNHGSVYAGSYGLLLQAGTLVLDPTATLFGAITSDGGSVEAIANADGSGGVVRLGQVVNLATDTTIEAFGSAPGVTLVLDGAVTSPYASATMAVTGGHVTLTNAADVIPRIDLGAGVLTIGATFANSGGAINFINPYTQKSGTALLNVSAGAQLRDLLTDLGNHSRIDLQGFAFDSGVTATLSGGVLTLNDGASTTTLTLQGSYTAAEFSFTHDAGSGTEIAFTKG